MPSLAVLHHPSALVKCVIYSGLSYGCARFVNTLCRLDARYLKASSGRSLHILPKGYRSPRNSFYIPPKSEDSCASRKRGRGQKICRGHM